MKKLVIGITAPGSVGLIRGQCRYFVNNGYKVFLLAPKDPRTIHYCEEEGGHLLAVNLQREINILADLLSLFHIIYHFVRIKPDIVNVGTPKVSLLGIVAAKLCGVHNRIYTCRGFRYEGELGRKKHLLMSLERITARLSNKIICISKSIETLGVKDGIFKKINKTIVIGNGSSNGLDLSLFDRRRICEQQKYELKRTIGLDNDKFVFGFVGRLVDRKGINELYDAFKKLHEEKEDIYLVMVGPIEWVQIKDPTIIEKYNSHPQIRMVGKVTFEKVPLYMSILDCFVLPTWAEGFGNVFIQAAAIGVPVIGNDVTGCRDAVKDGFNGVLIKKKKNSYELMQQMKNMMDNDEERVRLGNNGIKWAMNFDRREVWEGLDKVYRSN